MTPRKNRPVLFEVIARTQRARGRSFTTPPSTVQPVGAGEPDGAASGKPSTAAPTGSLAAEGVMQRVPAMRARNGGVPELVRLEDGRIHLSLSGWQIATAAVVLLVLLSGAYWLGRRAGGATPPTAGASPAAGAVPAPADKGGGRLVDPTPGHSRTPGAVTAPRVPEESAPPRPPESAGQRAVPATAGQRGAGATPGQSPGPAESPPAQETKLTPGYYVLVQHFRGAERAQADAAVGFLREAGIPCELRQREREIVLVATQRFASQEEAQTLLQKVLNAGRKYHGEGSGYDFQKAYVRKLN